MSKDDKPVFEICNPTWESACRIYCKVLRDPDCSEASKDMAERDILGLAISYDKSAARVNKLTDKLDTLVERIKALNG